MIQALNIGDLVVKVIPDRWKKPVYIIGVVISVSQSNAMIEGYTRNKTYYAVEWMDDSEEDFLDHSTVLFYRSLYLNLRESGAL